MSGPTRKVLVVDDDLEAAQQLAQRLRRGGHDARTAHDGEAALRAVAVFTPEVVLLDLGLPREDSYEVARRLRATPGLGDVVLVALKDPDAQEDGRRPPEDGFSHHLVKPADPAAVEAILRRK
jgi:CheY-like chemotaxis protein